MKIKTLPTTTITAGDPLFEGVINTVSPKTMFFLNSSDDLSGIREIQYRIDGGNWSTYLTGFSLPSVAGAHTIGVYQREKTFLTPDNKYGGKNQNL